MTVLPIVPYPDPGLRSVAAPVTTFDAALARLAADLLDTMRAAPGIGITAPHVGIGLRLVVIALPADDQIRTYANPQVEWAGTETVRFEEGSVSMPGVSADIERPARVRIRYHDLAGATRSEEAEGLLAVCLQHEIDQLDGIFWIQRLSRLKRDRVVRRFEKLRRTN
ncbi:peptide deformylase [Gluconacetobacter tumulisoli]|uniref:Peptide deformylase-like n=2 Tax=Gluconacetobacter tumulisoli TaxID=1286189 RepID=A0A7W4K6X0_9PROT|nr:peptide deformylase [Gluconacetobacter tumulisoli]MBB2201515.1 peptide deformylase [Gluconacetobacter tumulisoli]